MTDYTSMCSLRQKWNYKVQSMMKNTQDIDMTDQTIVVYTKNDSKMSQTVKPSAICDKN